MLPVCLQRAARALALAALALLAGLAVHAPLAAQPLGGGHAPSGAGLPVFGNESARPRGYVPPPPPGEIIPVADIAIRGNDTVSEARVRSFLKTRVGRPFDPTMVEADVRKLIAVGLFADVRTFTHRTAEGIVVTFEVLERPTIRYIKFLGNDTIREKVLLRETGLKVGDSLNFYAVEEARRKVEAFYRSRGYAQARVTIAEGSQPRDSGVVLMINEGPMARVWSVEFIGNRIASDGRLKTQIQSKPGFLYLFKGKVDADQINEDVDRLTTYYRSLGYFQARVGRELRYDEAGRWLTLRFVIDEGPRYSIRNVSFLGHEVFGASELDDATELKPGEYFNVAKMNRDVEAIRDLYGSKGYIFADIKADPRFLEEPGQLDLVYDIREGDPFRVGEINVYIEGMSPHTRQSVVLNRRGNLQPGDLIDVREIRAWERRLKSSQLFAHDPVRGIAPRVVVRPPEPDEFGTLAEEGGGAARRYRGQSPEFGDTIDDYGSPGHGAGIADGALFDADWPGAAGPMGSSWNSQWSLPPIGLSEGIGLNAVLEGRPW